MQLAARQLGHSPLRQVRSAHVLERRPRTPLDLAGRSAGVLDAERHLGEDAVEDHLVLGILEERRDRAGELGRPCASRVAAADLDAASEAAPVEVRHEAGKRADQCRLAAA